MGTGLPYAIGAQIANKDKMIIDIDGDGSFNMTLSDLKEALKRVCKVYYRETVVYDNAGYPIFKQGNIAEGRNGHTAGDITTMDGIINTAASDETAVEVEIDALTVTDLKDNFTKDTDTAMKAHALLYMSGLTTEDQKLSIVAGLLSIQDLT